VRSTLGHIDGKAVDLVRLVSNTGVEVDVIGLGAAVVGWRVPTATGLRSVVLGATELDRLTRRREYLGCVVGRVANRIPRGRVRVGAEWVTVDANEGSSCLHGGRHGWSSQVWSLEVDRSKCAVHASHVSPHGAMGFPGRVEVRLSWRLEDNTLHLDIGATTDRPTPLALTQHLYFNLDGQGTILDHRLRVDADRTLVLNEHQCPTGAWTPVSGTSRDYRVLRHIGLSGKGSALDHYFGFRPERDPRRAPVVLRASDGALELALWTDRPGVQIYDGAGLAEGVPGWPQVGPWSGICIEDHDPPGAAALPHLGDVIYTPDRAYRHQCRIRIGTVS